MTNLTFETLPDGRLKIEFEQKDPGRCVGFLKGNTIVDVPKPGIREELRRKTCIKTDHK
ncbi:unnamed protein product [marine sediment metagenome]|uniref:Uncharacterized protein n=1 Tax=marine sediment metagenome TaxID=412755 RepID=X1GSP6_9ZZZZ